MPRNFYSGTEAELYTGSNHFNSLIATGYATYSLSQAQATAYATANTNFANAYLASINPDTKNKSKTLAKKQAKEALLALISRYAKQISSQASVTPAMLNDLGLTVPKTRQPIGPLGQPTKFKVELDSDGSVVLKWKCQNPRGAAGTTYNVWREIGSGDPELLGATGKRLFIDDTIPAGTSTITYKIQAARSTGVGPWAYYIVNLGSGSTGATGKELAPVKIAA